MSESQRAIIGNKRKAEDEADALPPKVAKTKFESDSDSESPSRVSRVGLVPSNTVSVAEAERMRLKIAKKKAADAASDDNVFKEWAELSAGTKDGRYKRWLILCEWLLHGLHCSCISSAPTLSFGVVEVQHPEQRETNRIRLNTLTFDVMNVFRRPRTAGRFRRFNETDAMWWGPGRDLGRVRRHQ